MSGRYEYPWPVRALGVALAVCAIPFVLCLWGLFALARLGCDVWTVANRIVTRLLNHIERQFTELRRSRT